MAESEQQISGAQVLAHRQAMEDLVGANVVARAIATLSPAARGEYEGLTHVSWIAVDITENVLVAVAREVDREPIGLHAEITRLTLQRTLTTLWRLLLRVTTDSALVSRTPIMYSKAYKHGELVSKIVAPGRSEVTVRGYSGMSLIQIEALRVGVETVLTMAGRREVRVIGVRHAQGADYKASWK